MEGGSELVREGVRRRWLKEVSHGLRVHTGSNVY